MSEHFAIILKMVSLLWADMKAKTAYHIVSVILVGIFYKALSSYNFFYKYIPWLTGFSVLIILSFIAVTIWQAHKLESNAVEKEIFLQNQVPIAYGVVVLFVFCLMLNILKLHSGDPNKKHNEIVDGQKKIIEEVQSVPDKLASKLSEEGGFITFEAHQKALEKQKNDILGSSKKVDETNNEKEKIIIQIEYILSNQGAMKSSYEHRIESINEEIENLNKQQNDYSPELLNEVIDALKQGEYKTADRVLKQLEDTSTKGAAIAEAKYQRGVIAENNFELVKARDLYVGAEKIIKNNARYSSAAGRIENILGNYKSAENYHKKSLEINSNIHPNNFRMLAQNNLDIGTSLEYGGHASDAIKYYDEGLRMISLMENPDRLLKARILNNLGVAWRNKGHSQDKENIQKAIDAYKEALEIRKEELPKNHPEIAETLANYGVALDYLDKHLEALEYYESAYDILKKLLPKNHERLSSLKNNIATFYMENGDWDTAQSLLEEVLDISDDSVQASNRHTANVLFNYGRVWGHQGNPTKQIYYLEKALDMRRNVLPANSLEIADSLNTLGSALEHQNQNEEAIKYFEEAFKIFDSRLGKNHPSTIEAWNNLMITKNKR